MPLIQKDIKYAIKSAVSAIQKTLDYRARRIIVKINGADKSNLIDFSSLEVKDNLYSKANECYFTYEKYGDRIYVPAGGDEIGVYDRGVKIFGGKITNVKVRVEGKVLIYDVECKDWVDQLDGELVSETYENQTVNAIIADIQGKYATTFDITNVNCTTNIEAIYFSMKPVSKCLDEMAKIAGYHWYVDPDKKIYFFSEGSITSPFDITDTNGHCLSQSLEVVDDYEQIKNRVNIMGGNISNVQVSDATSIASYGEHEVVIKDDTLTSTAEATQKANAVLAAYKDPIKKGSFETYDAGLISGQKINVNSTIRGVSQDFIIRSVGFKARTPTDFIYDVEFMTQQDQGLMDFFEQEITKPSAPVSFGNKDFTSDIKFSIVNYHEISWDAGHIIMSSGETYNIAAGNHTFTNTEICYFNPSVSTTVLQFSTTFGDGVGDDRTALGYAIPNPNTALGAQFIPKGFMGGVRFWGGENIVARTIIADQIGLHALTSELITTGEFITLSAQIKDAIITDAKISGTLTVGHTEAKCTDPNADQTSANTAADTNKVQGYTMISGGKIVTGLLTADNIQTGTLNGRTIQTAPSGSRVKITGSGDEITFLYNDTVYNKIDQYSWSQGYGLKIGDSSAATLDLASGTSVVRALLTQSDTGWSTGSFGIYGDSSGINVISDFNIIPNSSGNYDLGNSSYYWRDLYLTAARQIYVGSTSYWLRPEQRYYSGHYAVGFDNLGDTMPEGSGIWDLGNDSNRFHTIYLTIDPDVSSSRKLKKNIKNTSYGLKDILKLSPVEFEFKKGKASKEGKKIGLIAEDVKKVIPEVTSKTGESYRPGNLIPVLINAVKELNQKVENLESKVGK